MLGAVATTALLAGCSSAAATATPATPATATAAPAPASVRVLAASASPALPAAATPATSAGPSSTPGTGDATGSWSGTWTRVTPAAQGALALTLQQSGAGLQGTITLVGSVCLPQPEAVTGTLNGATLSLSVNTNGIQAVFDGTYGPGSMSGTMTVTCQGLTGHGTWQATRH